MNIEIPLPMSILLGTNDLTTNCRNVRLQLGDISVQLDVNLLNLDNLRNLVSRESNEYSDTIAYVYIALLSTMIVPLNLDNLRNLVSRESNEYITIPFPMSILH